MPSKPLYVSSASRSSNFFSTATPQSPSISTKPTNFRSPNHFLNSTSLSKPLSMFSLRNTARLGLNSSSARLFSTSSPRSLARMQIIGRLADAPEVTPTSTGRDVIRYAVGVSAGPKNENGERATSWFRVAAFIDGPQRDVLTGAPKGTLLYLDADARMDSFEAQDGNKQTRLNLVQRTFEILRRPANNPDEGATSAAEDPSSGLGAS